MKESYKYTITAGSRRLSGIIVVSVYATRSEIRRELSDREDFSGDTEFYMVLKRI